MICPECGGAQLQFKQQESQTKKGEPRREEWWACPACDCIFTESELADIASGTD